jgi:hypothetical protein
MNEEFVNIQLPSDFKEILIQFEKKYNENAFSKFASYLGFSWIDSDIEVREYELLPFEAELPFATGSDGQHMGWLNLCPVLNSFKKPFICWVPLGQHIFYHGKNVIEIFENSIRYLHAPKYEEIDLDFLKKLGIDPLNGTDPKLINYDYEPLNKMPLEFPEDFQYEITLDGVGVVNSKEYFSTEYKYDQKELKIDEYIDLAKINIKNSFYGTTLFFLKEGYFRNYYETDKQHQILEILKMKEETYYKLQMDNAANNVKYEIEKRKTSR